MNVRDIPTEVIAAERLLSSYFAERHIKGWSLGGCADRYEFVTKAPLTFDNEREILLRTGFPDIAAELEQSDRG